MSEQQAQYCPLRQQAVTRPHAPALCLGDDTWNYAFWDRAITGYEQALQEQGLKRGDRVLVAAHPSATYVTLLWALFRQGIVACPVNPALPEAAFQEWAQFLHVRAVYSDDLESKLPSLPLLEVPTPPQKDEQATRHTPLPLSLSEGAVVIQTSGSTGKPKAALLSLYNFLVAAQFAWKNMPLEPGDRWLLSLPLFHVSGLSILFRCVQAGATVVIPEPGMTLEETLSTRALSHLSLVPTQLQGLLDSSEGRRGLAALKALLLGGAPASSALLRRACDAAVPLVTSYGMTETAAQCCAVAPGASYAVLQSSGQPLEKGSLRCDDQKRILYRGEALFQGYVQEDGSLLRPLTEEGWFLTGDCGYFDDAGNLHITGRSDACFISGGENIHPEEIEALLNEIPEVDGAVVVGLRDPIYGACPVAFIRLKEGFSFDVTRFRQSLEAALPPFKIPRNFYPWPDDAPSGMKIQRSWFTARGEDLTGEEDRL